MGAVQASRSEDKSVKFKSAKSKTIVIEYFNFSCPKASKISS